MERLHNGFTLEIVPGAFPLSTDSMALSGFVKLPKSASVLDLGSGCGTLGLMLCAVRNDCHITGIELDECAHNAALDNAKANQIENRFTCMLADLADVPSLITPGSFSCCVTNPPYFSGGFESKTLSAARQETCCTADIWMKAAAHGLKFGGDLFFVHKPDRLAQLFTLASNLGLEPKRLRLLRHQFNGPVSLILVQCRKGAKPGLVWEDAYLHETDGTPSEYYKTIYHL